MRAEAGWGTQSSVKRAECESGQRTSRIRKSAGNGEIQDQLESHRTRARRPKTHERGEATIEIVVEISKGSVHALADFATLQRGGSGEDGDLGRGLVGISRSGLLGLFDDEMSMPLRSLVISKTHLVASEDGLVDIAENLTADHTNVLPEVLRRQAELDKLLLLHEHRVGDIVDDFGAEYAGLGEGSSVDVNMSTGCGRR